MRTTKSTKQFEATKGTTSIRFGNVFETNIFSILQSWTNRMQENSFVTEAQKEERKKNIVDKTIKPTLNKGATYLLSSTNDSILIGEGLLKLGKEENYSTCTHQAKP